MMLGRVSEDPLSARRHIYRAVSLFADLSTPYWLELAEAELQRLAGPAPEPAPARPPPCSAAAIAPRAWSRARIP
jgi:hypothetical protein